MAEAVAVLKRSPKVSAIINDGDGKLSGLFVAADYVAEHEWGIARLLGNLGVGSDAPGVERRRITNSKTVHLSDRREGVFMWCWDTRRLVSDLEESLAVLAKHELCGSEPGFSATWGEDHFTIRAIGEEAREQLLDLWKQVRAGNVILYLGHETGRDAVNPFSRAGLIFRIVDRMPAGHVEHLRAHDEDHDALALAVESTNLKRDLEATGVGVTAVLGRWVKDCHAPADTQYDLLVMVCGLDWDFGMPGLKAPIPEPLRHSWVTVESVRAWLDGHSSAGN